MSESSKPKIPCAAADKWEAEAAQTQGPMTMLLREAAAMARGATEASGDDISCLDTIQAAMQSHDSLVSMLRAWAAECERSPHSYDQERIKPIAAALRALDDQKATARAQNEQLGAALRSIATRVPDEEIELSDLENHAYRRLLDVLGFEPLVAHVNRGGEEVVYGIHDEDGEVIAEGTSIGETIVNALYRRAFDSQAQLSDLRQDVFALQRAAKKLGLGE